MDATQAIDWNVPDNVADQEQDDVEVRSDAMLFVEKAGVLVLPCRLSVTPQCQTVRESQDPSTCLEALLSSQYVQAQIF